MAAQTRRAWKLQEFVAHGSNVNCLALGPTSGRVMVTGGEDRKVNMWAVGKPNVIMSLSGHTSPVECVKFNTGEDMVIAGSQSGTLKIWDLEAAKILRTLTGHKSSILSLDFHPFGGFAASGSLDTNVKLWDIRRKGCIFTYKGHTDCINFLQFSPDGRWIVSAGNDNTVKLWDLTAGKLIHEFKGHSGPVSTVEFHPREFFMATGSADRTVKFWDLESFDLVSSTDFEPSAVRCSKFHPDGICLFSGGQDSLRVYGWEPVKCYDSISLGWGKVTDITTSSNQLIGASFSQTNVSIWVTNIGYLESLISKINEEGKQPVIAGQPFEPPERPSELNIPQVNNQQKPQPTVQQTTQTKSPQRRAFDRPTTTSTKTRSERLAEQPPEPGDATSPSDPAEDANYEEIFKTKHKIEHTPPRTNLEPFPAPEEQPAQAPPPTVVSSQAAQPQPPPQVVAQRKAQPIQPQQPVKPAPVKAAPLPVVLPPKPEPEPVITRPKTASIIPSDRSKPAGLQMEDFLPAARPSAISDFEKQGNDFKRDQPSEEETLRTMSKGHMTVVSIMSTRVNKLSLIARKWEDGDIKGAIKLCVDMNDQAILVDLLNVLILKQTIWNLDICSILLPHLRDLLSSNYESYILVSSQALKLVLRNFAPVIKSNMAAPPQSFGVDIVREERYQKCEVCYSHMKSIRSVINDKSNLSGKLGSLFRELSLAFGTLD